jgi:hypothetical protein
MQLEAEPAGGSGPAARGEHAALRPGVEGDSGTFAQFAARRHKGLREARIEPVAADSERGSRQPLSLHRAALPIPDDLAVTKSILQNRSEIEPGDGRCVECGDELSADAMARKIVSFEDGDRNLAAAQRQPEGETSQAATDDFDRLGISLDHAEIRARS